MLTIPFNEELLSCKIGQFFVEGYISRGNFCPFTVHRLYHVAGGLSSSHCITGKLVKETDVRQPVSAERHKYPTVLSLGHLEYQAALFFNCRAPALSCSKHDNAAVVWKLQWRIIDSLPISQIPF